VSEATTSATARCRYQVADVTETPLPGARRRPDLRALSRCASPGSAGGDGRVARQLAPGGVLVVEEPERIDTVDADFRRYLELASVVVGARGG